MIDSNQSNTKMNYHTSGGKIYVYIYILSRNIYIYILRESFTTWCHRNELLKRFSDIFQSYLCDQSINLCDLSTKSYLLPGVSTYFPSTVTNFKVAVCHFVQAKVTGISGLSFSTLSSTFLRNNFLSTVRLNISIF